MASVDSDEKLVREYQAGHSEGFDALVERYGRYAYRVCYRILGDHHDAEDASQEAFVRAFRGLRKLRGESRFKGWLTRIVVNVCISRLERSRPRGAGLDSADPAAPAQAPPIELTEIQQEVKAAVESLPAKQRSVFVLRTYEECSFEQIAEVLSISREAARMDLSLARKKLREALGHLLVETR